VSRPLYLYGVVLADECGSLAIAGVEGSEVETIEHDGLAALASRIEGGALKAAREIRAHWRVLQDAAECATVLPARFGTVLEDEDAVRARFLEPNADRLRALLEALSGCVQLSVKGAYDEQQLLREVVASSAKIAALSARVRQLPQAAGYYERIRLGELIAGEIARRRAQDTEHTLEVLQPAAEASHADEPKAANSAFELAFLVRRTQQDEFSRRVRGLAEEVGERIDLRYVGPLPPYSFVEAGSQIGMS
jgi:Gas vesicle synthesis protein GvpL/GvpF